MSMPGYSNGNANGYSYPSGYGSQSSPGFPPQQQQSKTPEPQAPSSHVTAQQIKNFISGVKDSFKFKEVLERIMSDPRTQANMLRATMIQIILLVSVVALDFVIAPSLAKKGLDHSSAAQYWQLFWLYPLLGLSFFCAGIAHNDLASSGNKSQGAASKPQSKIIDNVSRALVIVQCFAVGFVLFRLPVVGMPLCFFYFCIVDAYYCFEYIWIAKGLDLKERAKFLEERWPYFAGFGVPSTVISFFHPSPIVNLALFSLAFPLNLLLAQHAKPPSADMAILGSGGEPVRRNPADRVPRLPVLWIAVRINDALHSPSMARMLNLPSSTTSTKKSASMPAPHMYPSGGAGATSGFGGMMGGSGMHQPSIYSGLRPQGMLAAHNHSSAAAAMRASSAQQDAGGAGQAHSVAARPGGAAYGMAGPGMVRGAGGPERRARAGGKLD